jgi:anti-anti-sigma regulatory factor
LIVPSEKLTDVAFASMAEYTGGGLLSFRRLATMAQPEFKHLKRRVEQGVLVLTLTDVEITSEGVTEDLRLELLAAVGSQESPKVVIDFQRVKLISTTCLRALLSFRRHLREKGGQPLLCNLCTQVAEVLFTTRMISPTPSALIPFAMAPDVSAAVAHLSASSSQR